MAVDGLTGQAEPGGGWAGHSLDMEVVHVDPVQEAGEDHHRVAAHSHDGLPPHSH